MTAEESLPPATRGKPREQVTPRRKRVVMVAAVADNGVIGLDGEVPWHIPADLRHFRETTLGHTVVMGRTTYEGIGHPLPYRTNVVLTRTPGWAAEGVLVAGSAEEAIAMAADFEGDLMIAGGTQVYAEAMPYATRQVLTEVHRSPPGDTYYPSWDRSQWRETQRQEHLDGDPAFAFVMWERV